jgi:hypothetical protein
MIRGSVQITLAIDPIDLRLRRIAVAARSTSLAKLSPSDERVVITMRR